jgi:hypothetical protein
MLTREKLETKLSKPDKIVIATVCVLPSGAPEVITNYLELEEKS